MQEHQGRESWRARPHCGTSSGKPSVTNPLDNPIWHALVGPHAHIAIRHGAARHYPRDMAPFSAIAQPTPEAYSHLAENLPAGQEVRLFRLLEEPVPAGWETLKVMPLEQMVLSPTGPTRSRRPASFAPTSLSLSDVADMLALADATQPGPFGPRTIELGRYFGLRDASGRLVAMAGERLRPPGHIELSAICVHPDARGQGLGAALTLHLADTALARGEVPFLHVFPDNPARELYARLGFRLRTTLCVVWRRPIAAATTE